MALVDRDWCFDATRTDLGDAGLKRLTGRKSNIDQLRAGGICCNLGLVVFFRATEPMDHHWGSIGSHRYINQLVGTD